MAVDTLYSSVRVLVQGNSAANIAQSQSEDWVVTSSGLTPATDRLEFTGPDSYVRAVSSDANGISPMQWVIPGYEYSTYNSANGGTIEMVVDMAQDWTPGAVVFNMVGAGITVASIGHLSIPAAQYTAGRTEVYVGTGRVYIAVTVRPSIGGNIQLAEIDYVFQPEDGPRFTTSRSLTGHWGIDSFTVGKPAGESTSLSTDASIQYIQVETGSLPAAQSVPTKVHIGTEVALWSRDGAPPGQSLSDLYAIVGGFITVTATELNASGGVVSTASRTFPEPSTTDSIYGYARTAALAVVLQRLASPYGFGVEYSVIHKDIYVEGSGWFTSAIAGYNLSLPLSAPGNTWSVSVSSMLDRIGAPLVNSTDLIKTTPQQVGYRGISNGSPPQFLVSVTKTSDGQEVRSQLEDTLVIDGTPYYLPTLFLRFSDADTAASAIADWYSPYFTSVIDAPAERIRVVRLTGKSSFVYMASGYQRQVFRTGEAVNGVRNLYALRASERWRARAEPFGNSDPMLFPELPWPTTSIPGGGVTPTTDPNTLLLLHFNDTAVQDGSNTYFDSSGNNRVVTGTHSTTDVPPGTINNSSELAPSFGKHLFIDRTPGDNGGGLTLGTPISVTGPWTLEWRWYSPEGSSGINIYKDTNNVIQNIETSGSFFHGTGVGSEVVMGSSYATEFSWRYLALVNDGTNLKLYSNGTEFLSAAGNYGLSLAFITSGPWNGFTYTNHMSATMRMEEVRLSSVARYTGNFTAPTEPFPDGGGGSGDGVPANVLYYYPFEAGDTFPLANRGSITNHILANSPTNIESDGSGGYVFGWTGAPEAWLGGSSSEIPAISGAITVEGWVYPRGVNGGLFGLPGFFFALSSGALFVLETGSAADAGVSTPGIPTLNQWNHIAYSRDAGSSGTARVFLNGVQVYTYTHNGIAMGSQTGFAVGNPATGHGNSDTAYDDLIVTGSNKYTADFTPAARGSAFSDGGGGGDSNIQAAGYSTIGEITGAGSFITQDTQPYAYFTSTVVLDSLDHIGTAYVVDNQSIDFSGSRTLANTTCTGSFVRSTPLNFSGDAAIDDVAVDATFYANVPVEWSGSSTIDDVSQIAVFLFLAPVEFSGQSSVDSVVTELGVFSRIEPVTFRVNATVLPATLLASSTQFFVDEVVPPVTLYSVVSAYDGFRVRSIVQRVGISAWTGMHLDTGLPAARLQAVGAIPNTFRVDAELPRVEASASLLVGGRLSVDSFVPLAGLSAWTGWQLDGVVPVVSASGGIVVGGAYRLSAIVPAATAQASAIGINVLALNASVPVAARANWLAISKSVPVAKILASITPVQATVRVGYSFTLANSAMTRYPAYPFIQVIRMGNKFYGVAEDGLHEIGGTTDNAVAIPWSWETCMSDFGQAEKKTVMSAYLGGVVPANMTYTIRAGDVPTGTNAHATTATAELRNHRQKFGIGRKSRFFAFGLAAEQGQVAIESIEFEVATMTRRI